MNKYNFTVSSNINEVIKGISLGNFQSFYFFFYEEIFTNKNVKKKHVSKHAFRKRLRSKLFIHLFAFCSNINEVIKGIS